MPARPFAVLIAPMLSRLLVPMLATGVLALACGPRSNTDAAPRSSVAERLRTEERAAAQRAASRARRAKHDGEFTPALTVQAAPGAVRFALSVANDGNRAIEMHFADGQTHDVTVVDDAGRTVWQWGEGRIFTQAHRSATIAGADTLVVDARWDARVAPGTYTAIATLRSSNHPVEQRATFVVR